MSRLVTLQEVQHRMIGAINNHTLASMIGKPCLYTRDVNGKTYLSALATILTLTELEQVEAQGIVSMRGVVEHDIIRMTNDHYCQVVSIITQDHKVCTSNQIKRASASNDIKLLISMIAPELTVA